MFRSNLVYTSKMVFLLFFVTLLEYQESDGFNLNVDFFTMANSTKMRLFGRNTREFREYLVEANGAELPHDEMFDRRKPTLIYSHGYTESPTSESVETVMSALMSNRTYNLIALDWSQVAAKLYMIPVISAPLIGRQVAKILDRWHQSGMVPVSKVYLVGHSLGAQLSSFIGKRTTSGKVSRITALDPAFPGFAEPGVKSQHLSPSDARFVDVIHTDGGRYGVPYGSGHVDFYPNGGIRPQPGCKKRGRLFSNEDFCSHWRSWRFFAESMNLRDHQFQGMKCANEKAFLSRKCNRSDIMTMGYHTPPSARGSYFLKTRSNPPYSMGKDGMIP